MLRILLLILGIFSFFEILFSATLPFTDVTEKDAYFDGVQSLYEFGIITDDGSHLFRPDALIERDLFVGLATSVSCRKCLTPSLDDIIHYDRSPFIDLRKTNPNYYCIAYANETKIVQWYTLSAEWSTTCEDTKKYTSTPFCEKNKTTRIEAAAMLLRQWKLWDDTRNSAYTAKIVIKDVQWYWQGYAEKWIQAGILNLSPEKTLSPDTAISRGEFAQMASTMLSFNQCSTWDAKAYTIAGAIWVINASGNPIKKSRFQRWDTNVLIPIVSSGSWKYNWKMINPETGIIKLSSSDTFPISDLGAGQWIVELSIIDPITGKIVSQPNSTIRIDDAWVTRASGISIFSDKNTAPPWTSIHFDSLLEYPAPGVRYSWDFGDGKKSNDDKVTNHTFDKPGNYTVVVTATDPTGQTSSSSMIITVGDGGSSLTPPLSSTPLMVNIASSPHVWDISTDFRFSPDVVWWVGNLNYFWNFGDGNTSDGRSWVSHRYDEPWIYRAELRVRDESGKESLSQILVNVTWDGIPSGAWGTQNPITVIIAANPPEGSIGQNIEFSSIISWWDPKNITYSWNYGDGSVWSIPGSSAHVYTTPWVYTVTLTIHDADGNVSQSQIMVSIDGKVDTDGDGIDDSVDLCIAVFWNIDNFWCPRMQTLEIYDQAHGAFMGDRSPSGSDRDGDGIDDALDHCPDVVGTVVNSGCPNISLLSGLTSNVCFDDKLRTQGIMIATPVCVTCPCENTISLMSLARSCDVLFPAILSKDQKNIYSRWSFYQVQ